MDDQSQESSEQLLSLTQAVREAQGKISYEQLWRGIKAGRIETYQPSGPFGHHRIQRAELERAIKPRNQK